MKEEKVMIDAIAMAKLEREAASRGIAVEVLVSSIIEMKAGRLP